MYSQVLHLGPHEVPNCILGTFGPQHIIRMFFPGIRQDGTHSIPLSAEERAELYNLGIAPTVQEVLPASRHNWPADYKAETFRARKHQHGFTESKRPIPRDDVDEFFTVLRRNLDANVPWARHYRFGIQICGTKDATVHGVDEMSREAALHAYLENLDTSSGIWFIDVALEFVQKDRALLWRSDAHHHNSAAAIGISAEDALAFTQASRHRVDPSSHLTALAGFRTTPHADQGGPFQITYLQAYTTDKGVTYNPEGRQHGKFINTNMAMKGEPPAFCTNLMNAYAAAGENLNVAARVEVRVKLRHASAVLVAFDDAVLRRSAISLDGVHWW